MHDYSNFIHINFIQDKLEKSINEKGVLTVGNNLNDYFSFDSVEKYSNSLKKQGNDRVQKSSKDVINGRIVEELVVYLLDNYFSHNSISYVISNGNANKEIINTFKIVNEKMLYEKIFDIDLVIYKKNNLKKYFLLSCKGTVRERIGQYISNLFLMDDRLIKIKYNDRYYLDYNKKGSLIKYGLITLDWAKGKDFIKRTKSGSIRKTIKQTEVCLINDDIYIGGGVTSLTNFENLDGVMNFGELVGKITHFLN